MIEIIGSILIAIIVFAMLVVLASIRIINQYQRGIKLTLGKFSGVMQPGLNFVVPLIQTSEKVDIRKTTINLDPQEVMTKDQVNLKIDGVVFYEILDVKSAILNVFNLKKQIEAKASSELKEIMGNRTMREGLADREKIAKELIHMLLPSEKEWGIKINSIQINNIELPSELIRAMSKQAEAEREKEARITKASGEFEASKKFSEASKVYRGNPEALRLRELQTYQEIGTEHNSLMIVIPETMANSEGKWVLPFGEGVLRRANKTANKEKKK